MSVSEDLNNKKLLVVRLSAIGDCIHTLPAVSALKQAFPQIKISWLVEKESVFLLENNPLINKIHIFDKKNYKKQLLSKNTLFGIGQLIKEIRQEEYDIAIDFQGLLKSALLTWLSGAKRTIGFKNTREFADFFVKEKIDIGYIFDQSEHIIEKNLKIPQYLGVKDTQILYNLPKSSQETQDKVKSFFSLVDKTKLTLGIIPGTLWKSKYWKTHHWIQLMQILEPDYNLVFIGTSKDQELINTIKAGIDKKNSIDLCGRTSLIELLELFNLLDIVIGVDTGPVHIAVATNHPRVICLFGPTSSVRNGAYKHINLVAGVNCQPCFEKKCLYTDDTAMLCMEKLTPDLILESIRQVRSKLV